MTSARPLPPLLALLGLAWVGACGHAPRAAGTGAEAPEAARARRPNVLLVMTDDQGLGDFSAAGNPVLRTPRLDAFAAQCPRVERFYVSPVCAPTRASLMTGRHAYRTRVVDTYRGRAQMEPDEVTLAEALAAAGYRTGIFGKWHLGDTFPMRPGDQGFDTSLVHLGGGLAQPSEPIENRRRYTDPVLVRDGERVATEGYCTQVYVDAALEFVDEALAEGRPFLAYVATNAPHDPLHDVPEERLADVRTRDLAAAALTPDGAPPAEAALDRIARVYAMLEDVDHAFGRLLDHLERRGVADDTVVVFLCDNGPTGGRFRAGLRGTKGSVYEGGVRSPLWVRWPGELDAATVVAAPAQHVDLLPTLLAACDVPAPAGVDGRDRLPELRGEVVDPAPRPLFVQVHRGNRPVPRHHFAVLEGRWKLVRPTGFGRTVPDPDVPLELYDLAADPFETEDLAAAEPEVVARLLAAYDAWFADVSTTRPDNFAPPRTRPGTDAEPVTFLTRQDWVSDEPESWGLTGTWRLELDRPRTLTVTLLEREPRVLEAVEVRAGAERWTPTPPAGARDTFPLGALALPAGPVDLTITCRWAGREASEGPYQVRLERP